jgi:hypothetical protein
MTPFVVMITPVDVKGATLIKLATMPTHVNSLMAVEPGPNTIA